MSSPIENQIRNDQDEEMGVAMQRQVGMKETGSRTTIPDNDWSRVSYYADCVTNALGLTGVVPADLTNYRTAYNLPADRKAILIRLLSEVLKPEVLIGKLIFPEGDSGLCGDLSNTFFEISQVDTVLAVQSQVVLAGQSKKVQKIMVFKQGWLERNYIRPLRSLVNTVQLRGVAQQQLNSNAIASLICGIVGLFIFGIIFGPIALCLAHRANEEIAASRGLQTGQCQAKAGQILGFVDIVVFIIVVIAIA